MSIGHLSPRFDKSANKKSSQRIVAKKMKKQTREYTNCVYYILEAHKQSSAEYPILFQRIFTKRIYIYLNDVWRSMLWFCWKKCAIYAGKCDRPRCKSVMSKGMFTNKMRQRPILYYIQNTTKCCKRRNEYFNYKHFLIKFTKTWMNIKRHREPEKLYYSPTRSGKIIWKSKQILCFI